MPIGPFRDSVLDQAHAYFEEFADEYDDAAAEAGWTSDALLTEELPDPSEVDRAVDLACGTGHTLVALRAAYPDAELVGVDVSASMLDRARARGTGAHLVQADLREYARATGTHFDLVTAVGGLEYVSDLPGLLSRLGELVRAGGHLIVTYEPLIHGLPGQEHRTETNQGSNGLDLTTLRWEPGEVAAGLDSLTPVRSRLAVAYSRDGLPTVYGWIHCRQP